MIKLLISSKDRADISGTSFGGKPVNTIGEDFQWPICACCELPMQFLGKISFGDELHQLFMCQNDPGMCDEWDANGGGNAVVVTRSEDLEFVQPPPVGLTLRETQYSARVVETKGDDYEEAKSNWVERSGGSPREVLGQISGDPSWIQADETPKCHNCDNSMEFVAQLEQGPDWKTEMNFGGGGMAYSFRCVCNGSAKFLWQS